MRPDVEFLPIAARVFSAAERAALARLPDGELAPAFYRVWTQKEAFIKALGEGLAFPLDTFDVGVSAAGLIACRLLPAERWTMRSLEVAPGFAAAFAVDGELQQVWRWRAVSRGDGGGPAIQPR